MHFMQIMILAAMVVHSGGPMACWYCEKPTATSPHPEIQHYENCAERVGETVVFLKEHVRRIRFDSQGLASALVGDQHYYIKPDGSMLAVITFDNWADDYSEGLVRSRVHGKVAYYDRQFQQVIPPIYSWGAPFQNGRALVCKGCTVQEADGEGHSWVSGGVWGYVDKQGNEVVPVMYTRKEAGRM